MQPQLEQTPASSDISTKQPSPSRPSQETDSAQDWRLQMLIERRKREAERASHNRNIVVTFAGPAHLDIESKSQTDIELNFQADEEPLPFVPSNPASLLRTTSIYYPIPIKRQASALFQCPASRCPSPSPSDTAWEDSEAPSISTRFTRCSLPHGKEEDTTNSDSEEEELQHVMSMIFDEED
ncbi:hypothetical protein R3P38DRAFT_3165605 [Favolaschia claudopus]|uniref:Uncharacterized protein n=1 Tax=Favolaschia claudopus TaxID=2862362 RepID=A0AAW0EIK8_9AGAR